MKVQLFLLLALFALCFAKRSTGVLSEKLDLEAATLAAPTAGLRKGSFRRFYKKIQSKVNKYRKPVGSFRRAFKKVSRKYKRTSVGTHFTAPRRYHARRIRRI